MSDRKKKQKKKEARSRRRELKRRAEIPSNAPLIKSLQGVTGNAEIKTIPTPKGHVKLSVALETLIEPFMTSDMDEPALKNLLSLGMMAWNAMVVGDAEREDLLQKIRAQVPPEEVGPLVALLAALGMRKVQLYPEDRRLIMSFHLTLQPRGGFYLQVAGTLPDDLPPTDE